MAKDKPKSTDKPTGKPSNGSNLQPKPEQESIKSRISCTGNVCMDIETGEVWVDLTKSECPPEAYDKLVKGLWKAENIEYKLKRPISIAQEEECEECPKEA